MPGRGSTHLSQRDTTPTFWNLQILTMAKIYKVYGMVLIQPSVKQKPGDQNANKLRKKVFGQRKTKRKKI